MRQSETPVQTEHETTHQRAPRERRPSQSPEMNDEDRISLMSWDSPLVRD